MKKSRKEGSDPLLALYIGVQEHSNARHGNKSSNALISRRTRTRLPVLPALLKPKVDQNVHQQIMVGKAKEALCYCKGAKDLKALRKGDTVRLIPPRSPTKEAVKARVHGQVGNRSYEPIILSPRMEPDTAATEYSCEKQRKTSKRAEDSHQARTRHQNQRQL